MSLASLDTSEGTLSWVCVGNIESMLVRSEAAAPASFVSLVQRAGVVGSQLPPLQATVTPIAAGDTLVMATDGIRAGFALQLPLSSRPQQIADHILSHHHLDKDDALVLVARYWGT